MVILKIPLFALLLTSAVCWSQCPNRCGSNSDPNSMTNSLIARSEMQKPQPLPIVKPLRLEEIPPTERSRVHPGSINADTLTGTDVREAIDIEAVNESTPAKEASASKVDVNRTNASLDSSDAKR